MIDKISNEGKYTKRRDVIMKKRILSVMLVMAMTAGMAAGCGNSDKNTDSNAKKDNASGKKSVLNFWCH